MHRSSSNDGNRSSNDGNAPAHLLEDVHVAAEYVEQDSEVVALVVGEGAEGDAGTGIGRVVSMCCKRMRSWKEGGYACKEQRWAWGMGAAVGFPFTSSGFVTGRLEPVRVQVSPLRR